MFTFTCILDSEFLNDTDLQNLLADQDCDEEWQVLIKQLRDIVKTKDEEIEHLDKEIVDTVCHIHNLEKVIKEQNEQLSHFKSQQVSKLKNQEMSLTDFKKRRSITQDTNRGLDSLEEPFLCPSKYYFSFLSQAELYPQTTLTDTIGLLNIIKI